jgi:hypothetical protein
MKNKPRGCSGTCRWRHLTLSRTKQTGADTPGRSAGGRGMNWLRFGATELLAMRRRWTFSTSIEELEVEEWVDSLPLGAPPPPQASCDGNRGARVLQVRELAGLRWRRAGKAHGRRWPGRVGCGCGGAHGCLRWRLGLGASEWVVESKRVPTGDIQTSVLAVGLRARQERYQCWRVA